ncbi:MAG TPA: hypothetical protein VK820_01355 [Steroidobacteraceae bacterium]|jgi:hypothetical protein|nr:hypothetical protein [Steroidobacteraceae bacterium]
MRILSLCVTLVVLSGLASGCQKREPTRPAEPTVTGAKTGRGTSTEKAHGGIGCAGFAESVRRRHFDLP